MKACVIATALALFAISASAQPMPPPVPPFLQGANPSVIQEFEQLIATSGHLTDAQIDAAVDDWVSKQSAGIKVRSYKRIAWLRVAEMLNNFHCYRPNIPPSKVNLKSTKKPLKQLIKQQ